MKGYTINESIDLLEKAVAIGGGGGGASTAADISYDNTSSGLTADDVQEAIDELKSDIPTSLSASAITYVNTSSGLTADDVQEAIDEVVSRTNVYSATETLIGKYLNAPLYQKTFSYDTIVSGDNVFAFDITSGAIIRDIKIVGYANAEDMSFFSNSVGGNSIEIINASASRVAVNIASTLATALTSVDVTVMYTKPANSTRKKK